MFSADGRLIASGDRRGSIRIWETATGKVLHVLAAHDGPVSSLVFSPDGHRLASSGASRADSGPRAKIWDVETAMELRRLAGHRQQIVAIAFSPDGALLATSGGDVTVWDTASGRRKEDITARGSDAAGLAFSPDGRLLAIRDGAQVRLRAPGRGEMAAVPLEAPNATVTRQHGASGQTVAFTRDGARVAIPDGEKLRVLDVATGRIVRSLEISGLTRVLWCTETQCWIDRIVATGNVELWDIAARRVVRTVTAARSDVLSADLRRVLRLNEPAGASMTLSQIGRPSRPWC